MLTSRPARRDFLRHSALASAGVALIGTTQRVWAAPAPAGPPAQSGLPDLNNRQGQYADVNGARLFYQVAGQGEPLMLLHGYPLSGALFARNRDALAARYQVITVDQRGYGNSAPSPAADSVATHVQDALALMDQLGVQRAIVGGMSMGGAVALGMYQQAPDRVRGLMLMDTTAAPANPAEAGMWRGTAEVLGQSGWDPVLPDLLKVMLTGNTRMNQPELVNYLSTIVKQAPTEAGVGGATALASRPDVRPLLAQIQVPTLVVVGVEDPLYPVEVAMTLQQAIPNARLATVPGAAHAAVLEAPDPVNRAILEWTATIA